MFYLINTFFLFEPPRLASGPLASSWHELGPDTGALPVCGWVLGYCSKAGGTPVPKPPEYQGSLGKAGSWGWAVMGSQLRSPANQAITPTAPSQHTAAPFRELKIQVKSSGVFDRGEHLWSAWGSQDAGTPGPGMEAAVTPLPLPRQKLLLESKWRPSPGRPHLLECRAPLPRPPQGAQRSHIHFLGGPVACSTVGTAS